MKRVIAYSYRRFSHPSQAVGSSLERQLESAVGWAAEHDAELDTSLVDRGLSGYTGANVERGDLGRFFEMVRTGRVKRGSYLLLDDMSRLGRLPPARAAHQLLDLALAGVKIVTLNDGAIFDENAELEALMKAMLKVQGAHDYSRELARKVRRGHKERKDEARQTGRIYSKTGPGWLVLAPDRSRWIRQENKVELVLSIVAMADEQGMGTTAIAKRLNSEKVPNMRNGSVWHGTTINKLLRSPALLGHYQPRFRNGKPDGDMAISYYGPGIVDEATYYRIQKRLDGSRHKRGRRPAVNEVRNILYGLSKCFHCGGNMTVARRDRDQVDVYQCYNMMIGKCDNRVRWKARIVEQYLFASIRGLRLDDLEDQSDARRCLDIAEGKHAEIGAKIERLIDEMEEGGRALGARLRAREAELAEVEKQIVELRKLVEREDAKANPADHQAQVAKLREKLATADDRELYDIRARLAVSIQELLDVVTFNKGDHVSLHYKGVTRGYYSGLAGVGRGVRGPAGLRPLAAFEPRELEVDGAA